MDRDYQVPAELIELGTASIETRSKAGVVPEFISGFSPAFLSDD